MLDASKIKEHLTRNAADVCSYLLPQGKPQGSNWRVGSIEGEVGSSLAIALSGPNAGLWIDHANDSGGDIIDLWEQVKGLTYPETLQSVADHFNLSFADSPPPLARPYTEAPRDWEDLDPSGKTYHYLTVDRKLDPEVIALYRVKQTSNDNAAVYLHYDHLKVCLAKYLTNHDTNNQWSNPSPKHTLFGKHTVDPNHTNGCVTITEGQCDAIAWAQTGIPTVSIPSGVSNEQWVDNDWDWLAQFHTIYISFDMDEKGKAAAASAINRLGRNKCRSIQLPLKDANDMIVAERDEELREAYDSAQTLDPAELVHASTFKESVHHILTTDVSQDGWPCIWDDFDFRIRLHEYTIWTGLLGHGKSSALSLLCAKLASLGAPSCIASLETRSDKTIASMVPQWTSDENIGHKSYYSQAFDDLSSQIIMYNLMERVSIENILESFTYAHKRWGIQNFVLDNVMMLKIDRQDNEAQANAAYLIKDFVRRHAAHIHVVAHPRKPPSGDIPKPPNPHEVRGASEWGDAANNVITVWRNLKKNDEYWSMVNQEAGDVAIEEMRQDIPDGKLVIGKQRETGQLPIKNYWFDQPTKLFLSAYDTFPDPLWTPPKDLPPLPAPVISSGAGAPPEPVGVPIPF